MLPSVAYNLYATTSYEQTGSIITFTLFEQGDLIENKYNEEYIESILDSIDDSSKDNDSDDGSKNTKALEDTRDRSQIYL